MPRFSQNFLIWPSIREKILSSLHLEKTDRLLEIGPGKGFLTKALLEKAFVSAVERDPLLLPYLQDLPLDLYLEDILSFPLDSISFNKIVSNIPYHITKPLLTKIAMFQKFDLGVFMVQKEVADKLSAPHPDTFFTAKMQAMLKIRYLFTVSKKAFSPSPKVVSAVIEVKPCINRLVNEDTLKVLQKLFSYKRKTLKKTFQILGMDIGSLKKSLWDKRVSENSVETLLELCDLIYRFQTKNTV